jgi:hypothetical protein
MKSGGVHRSTRLSLASLAILIAMPIFRQEPHALEVVEWLVHPV